ncbi:MAG: hypothetical protein Q7S45_05215 [Candidatus Curtissbacteria bacterium]|nr:hypothetical protein [Candidatus Curtissbacteria bacterium]
MKKGFVHLIPVVAIALVLSTAATIVVSKNPGPSTSVLSSNSGPGGGDNDNEQNESPSPNPSSSSTPKATPSPKNSPRGGSQIKVQVAQEENNIDEEDEKEPDEIEIEDENDANDLEDEIEEINRIRFVRAGDKFEIEAREGTGSARQRIRIEERPDRFEFRYKIGENEVKIRFKDGKFKIQQEGVEATTIFPIEINQETQTISVTTPKGTINIQVLPQQAITNLISNNVFKDDEINEIEITEGQDEESPNETVFKVSGVRSVKIFGLFNYQFPQEAQVSTRDGTIVSQSRPLTANILSFLLPGF